MKPTPSSVLTLLTLLLSAGQVAAAQSAAPTAPVTSAVPAELRSQVQLTFTVPTGAQTLMVVQALPAGAAYLPGSSRWNGEALPEPVLTAQGLAWMVPVSGLDRGTLTFAVTHAGSPAPLTAPAVAAGYPGGLLLAVSGAPDLTALRALSAPRPAVNTGSIRQPLDGSDVHVRDAVNVTVTDTGEAALPLLVNGVPVPEALVGERATLEGGRTLRTYIGVPLRPGANVLQHGPDQVTVYRVGPTTALELTPLTLAADGMTPLRVQVRAVDAFGRATNLTAVTVSPSAAPLIPDALPGQPGHQLRLEGGVGVLEFAPVQAPGTLTVTVTAADLTREATFAVTTARPTVGVALLSATLGLDGDLTADDLTWQGRASLDTVLGGGQLQLAADKDGLPTDADTLKRFNTAGDASTPSAPLQGADPVAFAYRHPDFEVQYRRAPLPIDVLPIGEQLTALSASSKTNPQVAGFVALVPTDRVTGERLTPDGTRLLRLARTQVSPGSETLTLVTVDRVTGQERARTLLVRNVDYQLDHVAGIVTLTRPLARYDLELGEQYVEASYRLNQPLGERDLAFGVQATYQAGGATLGAAAVHLDGHTTFGVRAAYQDGATYADALLATSGGLLAQAAIATSTGSISADLHVRYQDGDYAGLGKGTAGLNASGSVNTALTDRLDGQLSAAYRRDATTEQGQVDAGVLYRAEPFRVGAGLRYSFGDQTGLSAVGRAGYADGPLSVDLTHAQPLTGTVAPETTFAARYRVTAATTLGVTSRATWGVGSATILSLDSRVNGVDVAASYELPTADGGGNLARFGVSTTLPLTDTTSLGLYASATTNASTGAQEAAAGTNLRYKTDRLAATLGTDLVYNAAGFGVVVRGGVTGSVSDDLTLSADGLMEYGAGKNGQRAALGYAYRSASFDSLGTVRYAGGTLAGGQPELSSSLAATYHQPSFAVRAGVDTRTLLNDPDSFTVQAGISGTYYLTGRFGVGLWAHALTQPASLATLTGLGLEGSYNVLPGTWLTAGYNLTGFDGISKTLYTRPGLYLRLDLTLDDTLGARK